MIPPALIRELLASSPESTFLILAKLIEEIQKFVSPTFKGGLSNLRQHTENSAAQQRLLHACRLLCRILPIIFENEKLRVEFARLYCPLISKEREESEWVLLIQLT